MKTKWGLISSIIQLIAGGCAIASFAVLSIGGEDMSRWIITFILAILFVVLGIVGIIDYRRDK